MRICPKCRGLYPDEMEFCPKDGLRLPEPAGLVPGAVIRSKYKLISEIGRGGYGAVWRAHHLVFHEERALKILLNGSEEMFKAFLGEARVLRAVRHPHIVEIIDIDQTEVGQPFVVMELVEGESLAQRLRSGPIPVREAITFAIQACEALAHAHGIGVIHRDIKPQNILLAHHPDGTERVKLIDFGIAKVREETQFAVSGMITAPTGMVLGTVNYASPEQVQGLRGHELDGRSDVYSLGVVLYQMLTGRLPFTADSESGLLEAKLHHEPLPLQQTKADLQLPPGLSELILQALARDRGQRLQSARDMALALQSISGMKATSPKSPEEQPSVRSVSDPITGQVSQQCSSSRRAESLNAAGALDQDLASTAAIQPMAAPKQERRRSHVWLWIVVGLVVGGLAGVGWMWSRDGLAQGRLAEKSDVGVFPPVKVPAPMPGTAPVSPPVSPVEDRTAVRKPAEQTQNDGLTKSLDSNSNPNASKVRGGLAEKAETGRSENQGQDHSAKNRDHNETSTPSPVEESETLRPLRSDPNLSVTPHLVFDVQHPLSPVRQIKLLLAGIDRTQEILLNTDEVTSVPLKPGPYQVRGYATDGSGQWFAIQYPITINVSPRGTSVTITNLQITSQGVAKWAVLI